MERRQAGPARGRRSTWTSCSSARTVTGSRRSCSPCPRVNRRSSPPIPYGPQAQSLIAHLLRETPGFERIKNALANDGQLFPGVLTTGGVLVNANTRAVALRDLREQYVKVVVLPADAGPKEITELELRLQMEQEVKQEYSFTSQLLFIEDLINSGNYTTLEVGRALRPSLTTSKRDTKAATDLVEGELRLLGLIREVVSCQRWRAQLPVLRRSATGADRDRPGLPAAEEHKSRRGSRASATLSSPA